MTNEVSTDISIESRDEEGNDSWNLASFSLSSWFTMPIVQTRNLAYDSRQIASIIEYPLTIENR